MTHLRICALFAFLATVYSADWNYISNDANGPENWANTYPKCAHSSQTPIDIVPDDATYDSSLPDFTFTGYNPLPSGISFVLANNGHTFKVGFEGSTLPTITGGGLSGTYRLVQMHVHWGSDNTKGSEHTINGESFPAELHMVHMKTDYANFTIAQQHPDSLAVLGIMIEAGSSNNADYADLVDALSGIPYKGDEVALSTFNLDGLLPDDTDEYYRYSGSLTTPSCDEIVTWTVFKEPVYLSSTQIAEFRNIYENVNTNNTSDDVAMVNNYRPLQPLNGRTVKRSFEEDTGSAVTLTLDLKMIALIFMATLYLYKK